MRKQDQPVSSARSPVIAGKVGTRKKKIIVKAIPTKGNTHGAGVAGRL